MYRRILKKCILRISTPTLSKPLPSPHKEATVLTHKITSSSCLSCFCDLPRCPLAPKLDFSGQSFRAHVMETLVQYRHTLMIPPLKGIQTRRSLHLRTILTHTSTVSEPSSYHSLGTDLRLLPFPPTSSETSSQNPLPHHCPA